MAFKACQPFWRLSLQQQFCLGKKKLLLDSYINFFAVTSIWNIQDIFKFSRHFSLSQTFYMHCHFRERVCGKNLSTVNYCNLGSVYSRFIHTFAQNYQVSTECNKLEGLKKINFGKLSKSQYLNTFLENLGSFPTKKISHEDWKLLEKTSVEEDSHLSKSLYGLCLKIMFHEKQVDNACSLLKYIKDEGKTPNIGTLTTFIALLGVHSGKNYQEKIFEAFDDLNKVTDVFDSISIKNLILGFSETDRWKDCLQFLEMLKFNQQPTAGYYNPIVSAAFREGDWNTAFSLLDMMGQNNLIPHDDVYLHFVQACTGENALPIEKLLEYLKRFLWFPSRIVANAVMDYFEKKTVDKWCYSWTKINRHGVCNTCNHYLEKLEVSPADFDTLQSAFLQQALIGDNVFLKTTPDEVERFKDFVTKKVPFDIVLDALNIAHTSSKLNVSQLRRVVEYLTEEKRKKVLMIGRNHMHNWSANTMNYIKRKADCFFIENTSSDDPFILYATLFSGREAMFISRDYMRNHKFLLGFVLGSIFQKWQQSRQIQFVCVTKTGKVILRMPKQHYTCAQHDENRWHIPFNDGQERVSFENPDSWLCLRQCRFTK